MSVELLCHKLMTRVSAGIHGHRRRALIAAVSSVVRGSALTLTSIGRGLSGKAQVKHKIKRSDRLLGNAHLYAERLAIYQQRAHTLLSGHRSVDLLVDWSPTPNDAIQLLRASLAYRGRSIRVYEQVFPIAQLNQHEANLEFLRTLADILPTMLSVTLVTDAMFRVPWFQAVQSLGWDFIGRVRGNIHLRCANAQGSYFQCAEELCQRRRLKGAIGRSHRARPATTFPALRGYLSGQT